MRQEAMACTAWPATRRSNQKNSMQGAGGCRPPSVMAVGRWENHQRSKKHLKAVAELRAELEAEDAEFMAGDDNADNADNDDISGSDGDDNGDNNDNSGNDGDEETLGMEELELLEADVEGVLSDAASEASLSDEEGVSMEDQATMAALWENRSRTDHDRHVQQDSDDNNDNDDASNGDAAREPTDSVDKADSSDSEDDLLAAMSRLATKRQEPVLPEDSTLEQEAAVGEAIATHEEAAEGTGETVTDDKAEAVEAVELAAGVEEHDDDGTEAARQGKGKGKGKSKSKGRRRAKVGPMGRLTKSRIILMSHSWAQVEAIWTCSRGRPPCN